MSRVPYMSILLLYCIWSALLIVDIIRSCGLRKTKMCLDYEVLLAV
jgi:hypothetical protein